MAAEIRISINQQSSGAGIANAKRDLNDLSDTAARSGGGFNSLREVATGALRQVGAMATQAFLEAGRAAIGFFKDSISLAGDFEAGMAGFGAAAGAGFEVGTEKLDEFHDLFLDLGKKLPVSTSEVQKAAIALVKGGLDPAVIAAGALESSLNFAAAAGMGLEKAAELTIKQLGTFVPIGASVTEQTEFMANAQNLLVKAAGASTLNVDKLGDAMLQAGGAAKASGVDYEDFVTTMGLISPAFGSAAEAGTSFKNFVSLLVPSTEKAKDMMGALGLTTEDGSSKFYDAQGNFLGLRNAAELLQESFKGLSDAERAEAMKTLFGNDAKGAAIALMDAGSEGYDAFVAKMEAANGVTEQAAAVQQGFNFVMENIKGTIEALQIQIGEYLLPYLTELVTTANLLVNAITGDQAAFDALSPSMQGVVTFITGTLIPAVSEIATWLQGALTTAITFVNENWEAFKGAIIAIAAVLAAGMGIAAVAGLLATLTNPITLVIAAVGLLGAAWATDWMGIRTTLTDFWTTTGKPIFDQLVLWLGVNIPIAIQAVSDFWNNTLLPALTTVWNFISTYIIPIVSDLVMIWFALLKTELQLVADFWNNILLPALTAVWSFISTYVIPIVTTLAVGTFNTLKTATQSVADFWNNTLKPALNAVWTFLNTYVIPLFTALANVTFALVKKTIEILSAAWNNVLLPALRSAWSFITTYLTPVFTWLNDNVLEPLREKVNSIAFAILGNLVPQFSAIKTFVSSHAGPALQSLSGFADGASGAINDIANAVKGAIKWLGDLAAKINSISIPDWLEGHSPPPMANWFSDIGAAARTAARVDLPAFDAGLRGGSLVARATERGADETVQAGRQATYNQQRSVTYAPVYNNTASADPSMDAAFARSLAGGF